MEYTRFGLVVTCNYISDSKASQNDIFFILSTSLGVEGQSSAESTKPGGRGVVAGEHRSMLNCLRRCSQYAHCDKMMSSSEFLSMHMPSISFASLKSFIS